MTDKKTKTLSRAYTFGRKVYTPHSTDVPQELLDRDAKYLADKAEAQAAEDAAAEGETTSEDGTPAPRAAAKRAKKK